MRQRLIVFATLAALASSPALAAPLVPDAIYAGKLIGIITGGSATHSEGFAENFTSYTIPLTGTRVNISFTAQVTYDYVDLDDGGRPYPRYVVNSMSVSVTPKAPLGTYQSTQSNDYNLYPLGDADFIGNATNGRFLLDFRYDGDTTQFADFGFANARSTLSPVFGGGSIRSHQFSPSTNFQEDAVFTFHFVEGFVTGPGQTAAVPEPATWFMIVTGFGLVGAGMRHRSGRRRVLA